MPKVIRIVLYFMRVINVIMQGKFACKVTGYWHYTFSLSSIKFFHNVLNKVLSTYCMNSIEYSAKRKAKDMDPL